MTAARKPVRTIVFGPGAMGCDIAAIFLSCGIPVDLVGRNPARRNEVRQRVRTGVGQLGGDWDDALLRQTFAIEECDWQNADLVIETVPENLEVKREVFSGIDRLAPPAAIIGSNTSAFPISLVTEGLSIAPRAVGLHFFLPAHLVPLVEVVRGAETGDDVATTAMEMMKAVHRVPVLVRRDTPGFLANRIQHALMREVFAVLDEGLATPEDIDKAVRFSFGMRYVAAGPILQKEFAGLDTQFAAASHIYPVLASNTVPSESLGQKVRNGHLGVKAKHGFWEWTDDEIADAKHDYETRLLATLKLMNPTEGRGTPG